MMRYRTDTLTPFLKYATRTARVVSRQMMLLGYLETPSTPINHGQVSYCKPRWDAFGTGAVIRYCTHIGH